MGVSGNSVAGKSFQIFTVSEELLAKVVEAVQAGEKEARSSGIIQSFEVFCHGFRANISLGRIMVVPAKVCNDRENFPTALLHGAIIRVFGTGGEEVADLVEKKIGESEFDEYSQADFDTIKKEIFTDKVTGEEASLVVFAPNWMNSREYICFHFSDDAEKLKNDLRHQVFSAYYNPSVSSAFNALMTNVDTTKVDVTDITPKLSYPFLTENPLKQFPNLEKQAGYKRATILLNKKTADDITKQTLDPQELDVFDSLNQALENSLMPDTTSVMDAGEGGFRAPDDGGVPREASGKQAEEHEVDLKSKGKFDVEKGGLHKALGIPEDQTIPMSKLHSVMNGDYPEHVKNMARSAIGLKSMDHSGSLKVAHIDANGICPGCKKAGNECACTGCTCKSAFAKKAYVAHVPGHKNSKGEAAPWVIKQHSSGKILESFKSEAAAKAGLKNMESHKGSVELAPHEAPFTNVGPGSAAHAEQEASAPAMRESVKEDAGKADEESGSPIGIAIDETGVPRSKTEEAEGKSKSAKRVNFTPLCDAERVPKNDLSAAISAGFDRARTTGNKKDIMPDEAFDYIASMNQDNQAHHAVHDHQKEINAGAYGENPLSMSASANKKWGNAEVPVKFKQAAGTHPTGDDFTDAYIEAALWAETDPDTMEPLDRDHDYSDIAPATLERFKQDCAKFQKDNAQLLEQAYQQEGYNGHGEWTSAEQAGHDFWLTRNGHGAGFWDRDALKGGLGDALTKAAKAFREAELYVGDDGMIYQMGAEGTSPASYVAAQVTRTASAPYEAISAKAKQARAKQESLLDKYRPKTAVELDIDSIWDAITEDMGPAPLVDVPELDDTNPNPSNTEDQGGWNETTSEGEEAPKGRPNKRDVGDLPEAFRSTEPEDEKEISDSEAESQETNLENSATESEEHHEEHDHEEEQGEKWHRQSSWNTDSKYADFVQDIANTIETEEAEPKTATGEMSQAEANDPEEWPMHHAIAQALGGTVKPFDQYQGPYVLIGSEVRGQGTYAPATPMKGTVRLWIQSDNSEDALSDPAPMYTVYNEDNEKVSMPFMWNDVEGAVDAARSVLDQPKSSKGTKPGKGASGKQADTADNGYDIDKAPSPSTKENEPSDTVECHQDYNTEMSEGTDRPKPEAGADIKQAGSEKRRHVDEMIRREEAGECVDCGKAECECEKDKKQAKTASTPNEKFGVTPEQGASMIQSIRHGDRVTILRPAGMGREGLEWKEATGKAVMHSSHGGWVLNMGGPHGTPGLADAGNIVRVKKSKPVPGQERLGSEKQADTADNPANWKGGEGIIQPKTDADIKDTTGPDAPPPGQKQADDISGDASEAKSETVSPDTVDKDIQQPTVSVSEAAKVAGTWMNEYEIEEGIRLLGSDPVVGKYVRFLAEFRDEVNGHSDGWAYWKQPAHAAAQLMTLIKAAMDQRRGYNRSNEPQVEVTEQLLRRAMGPIKSFMTKRGLAAGMQMPHLAADISGDMSEAKSELDYNKSDMADEPKATDTVNPEHFASKGNCAECGDSASLDKNGLCHECSMSVKASVGERHDDVPVSEGEIPDEKQPKSDLSGAAPEAHDAPPQVDSKKACGEDQPESIAFDWGAGDLADIVLIEDEEE